MGAWLGLLLLAGCHLVSPSPGSLAQAPGTASTEALSRTVHYLASDPLQGRGLGTEGIDSAAHYIAGHFRGLGLKPPGKAERFQTFEFGRVTGPGPACALKVGRTAGKAGQDYHVPFYSALKEFEGEVAFVGYGVKATGEKAYDDFAGVDLKGRVALAMRYEPQDQRGQSRIAGRSWSPAAMIESKAREAAEHGAVALLVAHPPGRPLNDNLAQLARQSSPTLAIPVLILEPQVAEELFRRAGGMSLLELQKQIDKDFAPQSRILKGVRVSGRVDLIRQAWPAKNVMAFLPGRGPLAKEIVVVGAHYDHVGFGRPGAKTGAIHPGADDNASGVAGLLELARIYKTSGSPGRSILFVAFSAEEMGLVGSRHFLANLPVPRERVVAMLNLDMLGRLRLQRLMVSGISTSPALAGVVDRADEESPLSAVRMWNDGKAPSDILAFVERGIPGLFLCTGIHGDVHKPSDTPDRINYAGHAHVVDFAAAILRELTTAPSIPWQPATQPN